MGFKIRNKVKEPKGYTKVAAGIWMKDEEESK